MYFESFPSENALIRCRPLRRKDRKRKSSSLVPRTFLRARRCL